MKSVHSTRMIRGHNQSMTTERFGLSIPWTMGWINARMPKREPITLRLTMDQRSEASCREEKFCMGVRSYANVAASQVGRKQHQKRSDFAPLPAALRGAPTPLCLRLELLPTLALRRPPSVAPPLALEHA
jgi:hypothetical protein